MIVTPLQRQNAEKALAFFKQLPDRQVRLKTWLTIKPDGFKPGHSYQYDCGTIACFGGWCPYLFADQGVISSEDDGYPVIPDGKKLDYSVSKKLFGGNIVEGNQLFYARSEVLEAGPHSDREVVIRRLEKHIENTTVA